MAQRYKDDVLHELPEVDAVLGTGSYGEIARAVDEVMAPGGLRPCYMGDIQNCVQGGARILSTPSWYAYLRIAEGCDNCCAYCVIPRLRGRYRSRPMNELLDEASELASAGVKELIVIAQDITRYGTDLNGEHQLAALLRELCKLDFHWIRLHYLYPDDITDELIDTIAQEKKIVPYLDIPIQHCNDDILKAMNRRDTKESIRKVFHDLRARIPGLVLRTSIIAGLPGEGEKEFEELCDFCARRRSSARACSRSRPRRGRRPQRWSMFRWRRPSAARSFWSTCRVTSSMHTTTPSSAMCAKCCARAGARKRSPMSAAATPNPWISTERSTFPQNVISWQASSSTSA